MFWNGDSKIPVINPGIEIITPQSISENDLKQISSDSYEKIIIDMKESVSPADDDWMDDLIKLTEELPVGDHRIQFVGTHYLVPGTIFFVYYLYKYLDGISIKKDIKISTTFDIENQIYYTSIWLKKTK